MPKDEHAVQQAETFNVASRVFCGSQVSEGPISVATNSLALDSRREMQKGKDYVASITVFFATAKFRDTTAHLRESRSTKGR